MDNSKIKQLEGSQKNDPENEMMRSVRQTIDLINKAEVVHKLSTSYPHSMWIKFSDLIDCFKSYPHCPQELLLPYLLN